MFPSAARALSDDPCMERVAGIEPAPSAWKAEVLPLNYTRRCRRRFASLKALPAVLSLPGAAPRVSSLARGESLALPSRARGEPLALPFMRGASPSRSPATRVRRRVVEGVGFEPTKAKPSDLQSGPFGHSGTPPGIPHKRREIVRFRAPRVNDGECGRAGAAHGRANRNATPGGPSRETARDARPGSGAATRNRTLDLLITSELLYRLSYGGRKTSKPARRPRGF